MAISIEELIKHDFYTDGCSPLPPWKTALFLQNDVQKLFYGTSPKMEASVTLFSKGVGEGVDIKPTLLSVDEIKSGLQAQMEALFDQPVSQAFLILFGLAEAVVSGNCAIFDWLASQTEILDVKNYAKPYFLRFVHTWGAAGQLSTYTTQCDSLLHLAVYHGQLTMFRHLISHYQLNINEPVTFSKILIKLSEGCLTKDETAPWSITLDDGEQGMGNGFEEKSVVNRAYIYGNRHVEILNDLFKTTMFTAHQLEIIDLAYNERTQPFQIKGTQAQKQWGYLVNHFVEIKGKKLSYLFDALTQKSQEDFPEALLNIIEQYDTIDIGSIPTDAPVKKTTCVLM